MATDIKKLIGNLLQFYDFSNQTVISVGAGGGQLVEYSRSAKKVYAIDNDKEALKRLEVSLEKNQLIERFALVHSDFFEVKLVADVVMFEFCLHEMHSSSAAVDYAKTMAPDILICDHWPNSEWTFIVDEKEKVINSWKALERFKFRNIQNYETVQFFHDYQELYEKVKIQGQKSIERIKKYRNSKDFTIPMSYGFALI